MARLGYLLLLLALAAAACAPGGGPESGSGPASGAQPARALVIITRVEPEAVAARIIQQAGTALHVPRRIFNARMALIDSRGLPIPELAESLPTVNTDSWRLFPDGRMETTYRLKPNLTWHDGRPLTADDLVFGWRVYAKPELGAATTPPLHAIEEVIAQDARTVVIRWRVPYADAETLSGRDRELPPLPRHLLQEPFEQQSPDAFASHPYWTREYVAAGPYRLERWEPGAFIDAVAFDGYALGRPKIERIQLRFIADPNTLVANILAGEVHVATDNSIGQNAQLLQQEWERTGGGGKVLHWPNAWRHTAFQLRPEVATPRAILDARVRKALAHTVDRESIRETIYGGTVILGDSMIWSGSEWGAATSRPIPSYPYDLRQADRLIGEAGFRKGGDGFYASAAEGRLSGQLQTQAGPDNEPELAVLASGFRQAGFDVSDYVLPRAQAQDSQVRATFPTMATSNTNMGESAMLNLVSDRIPGPGTRWVGGNRGGWSNSEYDRLAAAFTVTLDRAERVELVARMLQIYGEELPAITLYFRAQPLAHVADLRGPATAAPESSMVWDVHQWEFR